MTKHTKEGIDTDGRPCSSELDGRLIGLTLTDLLSIPMHVAVACERERVPAVAAALAGRFANVHVTDVYTAAALIAYAGSSQASVGAPSRTRDWHTPEVYPH